MAYGELEFPLTVIPVKKQTKKYEMCYTPVDVEKLVSKVDAERSAIDRKILRKILLQNYDAKKQGETEAFSESSSDSCFDDGGED